MAGTNPYSQLTGVLSLYVAVYGTPEPDVAATPPAAWIDIGCTDGDQTEEHGVTDLTKFYVIRTAGAVSTPTATTKRLPIKRSFYPTEYALLAKSAVDSAYGALPGQLYIPRGVFDMKFSVVRSKTARAGFATMFHALEDDAQVEMDRLGWKTMATA
jgi:hypothetical protein